MIDAANEKLCKTCLLLRPITQFTKNRAMKDNLCADCKTCAHIKYHKWANANLEKLSQYARDFRTRNPGYDKRTRSKRSYMYDITQEELDILLTEQKGMCAICGGPPNQGKSMLSIDHDHKTKKVRGLLCNNCNVALGFFNDDSTLLHKAADYLDRSRV